MINKPAATRPDASDNSMTEATSMGLVGLVGLTGLVGLGGSGGSEGFGGYGWAGGSCRSDEPGESAWLLGSGWSGAPTFAIFGYHIAILSDQKVFSNRSMFFDDRRDLMIPKYVMTRA